eukprot:c24827_g1_i4 orf=1125-2108(-)
MVTLSIFTTEQACLSKSSACSEAFCRRVVRIRTENTYLERCVSIRARVLKCSRKSALSSFFAQPSLRGLRCVFKVCAIHPSSSPSSSYVENAIEVEREEGMPIPGTITFRRSSTQRHYEYLTDLETLGMESFSSELSRTVALSMGIFAAPNSEPSSTPASVSIDVTKEGRDLRLDGIVRTALALKCCRCGTPVGERVFGEFSLLLTEKPVVEPTKQRIGVVLGEAGSTPDEEEDLEEILDLDLDDKMHFPKSEKSIDISKYIRDTVHLEIPLQCLCLLSCKGRCIDCGKNLNTGTCSCGMNVQKEDKRAMWGPLDQLKKQLESEGSN